MRLNIALLLVMGLLFGVEAVHFIGPGALRQAEADSFPSSAVRYLQTHALPPRTLAAYEWGGYLLWKSYPAQRDFIDGRANTLFDNHILAAYMDAYDAAPDW